MSALKAIIARFRKGDAPPPELDRLHAALRVSTESLLDPNLSTEERHAALTKSLDQFTERFMEAEPATLKKEAEPPPEDEEEEGDETAEEEEEEMKDKEPMMEKAVAATTRLTTELQKRVEVVTAEKTELQKRIAKLEDEQRSRDRIAKATALAATTGQSPEAVATVLAKIEGDEPAMKAFGGVLDALKAAQSEASLFKAIGYDGPPQPEGVGRVEARATELRKADPKLSHAQAVAKAAREMPDDAYIPTVRER